MDQQCLSRASGPSLSQSSKGPIVSIVRLACSKAPRGQGTDSVHSGSRLSQWINSVHSGPSLPKGPMVSIVGLACPNGPIGLLQDTMICVHWNRLDPFLDTMGSFGQARPIMNSTLWVH